MQTCSLNSLTLYLILTGLVNQILPFCLILIDTGLIAAASKQLDTFLPNANSNHIVNNISPIRHLPANGSFATKPLQNGHVKKVTSNGAANGNGNGNYYMNGNGVHK